MRNRRITRRTVLGSVSAASLAPVLPLDSHMEPSDRSSPTVVRAFSLQLDVTTQVTTRDALQFRVLGGQVAGAHVQGIVQSGQVSCRLDAQGAVLALEAQVLVQRHDGELVLLRDQSARPAAQPAALLPSRPELLHSLTQAALLPALLVGRWDLGAAAQGRLQLLAFEVR